MFSRRSGGTGHSRSLYIAESCPLHLDLRISPSRGIADLASNMLPFKIAIGPYDKSTRMTSLSLDIGGNSLLVLHESVRTQGRSTFDTSYN